MIADSKQVRFDRSIYLTYIELGEHTGDKFKHVTEDEFRNKLYNQLNTIKTFESDKSNPYRIADSREIWYSRGGNILGEIWIEGLSWEEQVKSWWIKE